MSFITNIAKSNWNYLFKMRVCKSGNLSNILINSNILKNDSRNNMLIANSHMNFSFAKKKEYLPPRLKKKKIEIEDNSVDNEENARMGGENKDNLSNRTIILSPKFFKELSLKEEEKYLAKENKSFELSNLDESNLNDFLDNHFKKNNNKANSQLKKMYDEINDNKDYKIELGIDDEDNNHPQETHDDNMNAHDAIKKIEDDFYKTYKNYDDTTVNNKFKILDNNSNNLEFLNIKNFESIDYNEYKEENNNDINQKKNSNEDVERNNIVHENNEIGNCDIINKKFENSTDYYNYDNIKKSRKVETKSKLYKSYITRTNENLNPIERVLFKEGKKSFNNYDFENNQDISNIDQNINTEEEDNILLANKFPLLDNFKIEKILDLKSTPFPIEYPLSDKNYKNKKVIPKNPISSLVIKKIKSKSDMFPTLVENIISKHILNVYSKILDSDETENKASFKNLDKNMILNTKEKNSTPNSVSKSSNIINSDSDIEHGSNYSDMSVLIHKPIPYSQLKKNILIRKHTQDFLNTVNNDSSNLFTKLVDSNYSVLFNDTSNIISKINKKGKISPVSKARLSIKSTLSNKSISINNREIINNFDINLAPSLGRSRLEVKFFNKVLFCIRSKVINRVFNKIKVVYDHIDRENSKNNQSSLIKTKKNMSEKDNKYKPTNINDYIKKQITFVFNSSVKKNTRKVSNSLYENNNGSTTGVITVFAQEEQLFNISFKLSPINFSHQAEIYCTFICFILIEAISYFTKSAAYYDIISVKNFDFNGLLSVISNNKEKFILSQIIKSHFSKINSQAIITDSEGNILDRKNKKKKIQFVLPNLHLFEGQTNYKNLCASALTYSNTLENNSICIEH